MHTPIHNYSQPISIMIIDILLTFLLFLYPFYAAYGES